jgi:acylphosphatase
MGTRVVVSGRVQGVGFRWAAAQEAERLGVRGTIVNLADGRVEAVLDGSGAEVDAMVEWLGRGPALAQVDGVEVGEAPGTGAAGFRIL